LQLDLTALLRPADLQPSTLFIFAQLRPVRCENIPVFVRGTSVALETGQDDDDYESAHHSKYRAVPGNKPSHLIDALLHRSELPTDHLFCAQQQI
jgi:hypothetical protein